VHWLESFLRHALTQWGYWAVLVALLGESAGVPLPGETALMLASFVAHKSGKLEIGWVIVVGIAAAVAGDNLGFWVGRKLRGRLIRWWKKIFRMDDTDIGAAREQMQRHGAATVFWARYIFGLRTVAGPLAGMLEMEWKRFLLFNVLGAASWVTAISLTGYGFADKFTDLLGYIEKASWGITGALFATGYIIWRHQKKKYKERHHLPKAA
jgi:membrane protein DedA with SNARE-associated domain